MFKCLHGFLLSVVFTCLHGFLLSVVFKCLSGAASAALPSPTSVCDDYVLNWIMLQPQEQRYPVLPLSVMIKC